MQKLIPVYTAEGRRWRDSSVEAVGRWLKENRVVVKRNRRGRITAAQFLERGKVRKSPPSGTRYSSITALGDYRVWEHSPRARSHFMASART